MTSDNPIIAALSPITSRVRTDVTAVKNASGIQAWTRQPLTTDRLAAHLNGGPARGVCPIKAGESVTMVGLLDFDSHGGETSWFEMSEVVRRVVDILEIVHGASPILFRSSGGRGAHLYVLFDGAQDAYSVRQWLSNVLTLCGLRSGSRGVIDGQVEVFPKQDSVSVDGFGNQFVLPLAGKSELVVYDDLSGMLADQPREALLTMQWWNSPPVPVLQRPERAKRTDDIDLDTQWYAALQVIPNGHAGTESLDYDQWFRVIAAIHYETQGSDDGLAIAEEFSSRSPKCDLEFFRNRVWPYINSERGGSVVTGRSIMAMASRYGWHAPLDDPFEVLDDSPAEEIDAAGEKVERATPVERRGVPLAQHRCTDQANANRLVRAYGRRALCSSDQWHVDDGKRWALDEAGIYRYVCQLSRIVGEEARRKPKEK